jgi:hypothetical protein
MITKEFLDKRVTELVCAYDSTVERLHNIAGAIQEVKYLIQQTEKEQEKKEVV